MLIQTKLLGQTDVKAAEFILASMKAMNVRHPKWIVHCLKQTSPPRKGAKQVKHNQRKRKQKKRRK